MSTAAHTYLVVGLNVQMKITFVFAKKKKRALGRSQSFDTLLTALSIHASMWPLRTGSDDISPF